jgi:hypothetical protein
MNESQAQLPTLRGLYQAIDKLETMTRESKIVTEEELQIFELYMEGTVSTPEMNLSLSYVEAAKKQADFEEKDRLCHLLTMYVEGKISTPDVPIPSNEGSGTDNRSCEVLFHNYPYLYQNHDQDIKNYLDSELSTSDFQGSSSGGSDTDNLSGEATMPSSPYLYESIQDAECLTEAYDADQRDKLYEACAKLQDSVIASHRPLKGRWDQPPQPRAYTEWERFMDFAWGVGSFWQPGSEDDENWDCEEVSSEPYFSPGRYCMSPVEMSDIGMEVGIVNPNVPLQVVPQQPVLENSYNLDELLDLGSCPLPVWAEMDFEPSTYPATAEKMQDI